MGRRDKRRTPRIALGAALALAALIAGAAPVLATRGSTEHFTPAKVDGKILDQLAANGKASFVIYLKDQADLSAAYKMQNQNARGWYVYKTLKEEAARTQGPIKAMLASRGVSYRSFWVANVIMTSGDRSLVNTIAARSDVKTLEASTKSNWLAHADASGPSKAVDSPGTVEPGPAQVHAPQVWALGYTGQGIVVGNEDTGMRWTHNALKPHYRGWNGSTANHNYNWHDSIHSGGGICSPNHMEPCDDNDHGSHTTGLAVGDDGAGNQIGVAPGAKWIGCRNMDQGNGTPATYTECFQWFIAPTDLNGQNPNPDTSAARDQQQLDLPCRARAAHLTRSRRSSRTRKLQASSSRPPPGNGGSACSTRRCAARDLPGGLLDRSAEHRRDERGRLQQPRPGHGRRLQPDQARHRRSGQPKPLVGEHERHRVRVVQRHLDGRPARRRRRRPALVGSPGAGQANRRDEGCRWRTPPIRT